MPTWQFFDAFKTNTLNGTQQLDLDTDVIKIALFNSTAAPDADLDTFLDDLTGANEVTGTNYTAGGIALTTRTINEAGGVVTYDADDVTWLESGAGFSNARYAILYEDTGVETTSAMIAWLDFTVDKGNVNGDLKIAIDTNGILTLT